VTLEQATSLKAKRNGRKIEEQMIMVLMPYLLDMYIIMMDILVVKELLRG